MGGCNLGPCYALKCKGKPTWFEQGGTLYGTAAAGVKTWTKCGQCFKVKIMPQCASIHGGPGCNQPKNTKLLGKNGRTAYIMVLNECPECKAGHFDFCQDGNWGGTVLGKDGGIDNPALMYEPVACPGPLKSRMQCS